jgi:hypothetical protein
MNNVWKSADKVKLVGEGVKDGISVVIGGVGAFASSLIGVDPTTGGLLASLGFRAMDRALSRVEMPIGDRLSRLFNNEYLVNIYDFKQKYNLE